MVFYIYDFTEPCAGKKCRILLIHRLIYQMLQHVLHITFILEMMCHNEVSGIHKILTSLLFRIAWWTCSGNSKPFLPIFFFFVWSWSARAAVDRNVWVSLLGKREVSIQSQCLWWDCLESSFINLQCSGVDGRNFPHNKWPHCGIIEISTIFKKTVYILPLEEFLVAGVGKRDVELGRGEGCSTSDEFKLNYISVS